MLNSGNNLSRGNAALSSDMPPLPQCLPLEPITLGNQKYTRSGELHRVLGVPLGNTSEDHSFGVAHPKPPPPVASEELKHFKESVQDASRKARDRAKKLRESIFKLDKYREALSSRKRQRSDISSSERTTGVNLAKMGSQIHKNSHDVMNQRLEDRPKSVGLNKRARTSVADVRADNRATVNPRQHMVAEKDGDVLSPVSGGSVRIEEKTRRLPTVGEGWETKLKRKRSFPIGVNRVTNGDREIKRAPQPKISSESKLRSCDVQGFRSKSSPGVSGINKLDGSFEPAGSDATTVLRNELESTPIPRDRTNALEQKVVAKGSHKTNLQEDNPANFSSTVLKGKISRAPRTSSIMVLDSSSKVQPSSGALQGWEQSTSLNKISTSGVGNNQKRSVSSASSSHAMAQWVGQRPHNNSRSRRANLVSPVSNHTESQPSPQGFVTSDFSNRTSFGVSGSVLASSMENVTPKIKREPENVSSPFGLSESEESGAGENKLKEKGIENGEVALPPAQKTGIFTFSTRKNKVSTNEVGDGVRRQGRSGSTTSLSRPGLHPMREKLENLPTTKPIQSTRSASDKSKSKTGRPPSKKLKDRKASTRIGSLLTNASSDFAGESDDDRDELFSAASSAHNASSIACSGPFWKKMESIFASISNEDASFLKQQLSLTEELDESLFQIFGAEYNILGVAVKEEASGCLGKELTKTDGSCRTIDSQKFGKVTPLYQRVLSALIDEDENEEFYNQSEGKNMSLHYASDDSHCGSCNQIDIEPKDRDRMESEVESNVDFQSQKSSLLDRLSSNISAASNTFRNPTMSNSLHSSGRWLGDDDFSHSDVGLISEICLNDLGQLQAREVNYAGISSSDCQYEQMSLDDKLLLELQSIGLYPEPLPDLSEGEEAINQNVLELNERLYQQIRRKRRKLGKIDEAIQGVRDVERRNIEHVAVDQLVQMAYRKRLACRGSNSSKNNVRKVSKQVALAFVQRTLARCRKFEETGTSCFREPTLQDILFATPPCSNDAKSVDCVGSGTASNTFNETSNHQAEARASGAVSSTFDRYDSSDALPAVHSSEHAKHGSTLNKGKKREVLIDDVVGSASSRITSTLNGTVTGGVRGKRSDRDQRDNLKKTKPKPKQKNSHLSTPGSGLNGRLTESILPAHPSAGVNASNNKTLEANTRRISTKETDEPIDFSNLQFDSVEELGVVSNDLGGQQDLSSWLSFDEDGLQDHDSIGLEIPMDDLSELKFAF